MTVRFFDALDLSVARSAEKIEGAGQLWVAYLRNANVVPTLHVTGKNGDVQDIQITEPVAVRTPYDSIAITNAAGVGTIRIAVSDNVCDNVNLGGVANVLDSDIEKPETQLAGNVFLCGGSIQQAGALGAESSCQIFNPVGSGFLGIITTITVATTVAELFQAKISGTALGNVVQGLRLDTRNYAVGATPTPNSILQLGSANALAIGTAVDHVRMAAATNARMLIDRPVILREGMGLNVTPRIRNALNFILDVGFGWYEITA